MKRPNYIVLIFLCTIGYTGLSYCNVQSANQVSFSSNLTVFEQKHATVKAFTLTTNPYVLPTQLKGLSFSYGKVLSATATLAPPVVYQSSEAVSLTFANTFSELGCVIYGYTGYCSSSEQDEDKINGDDGVDVTGAPDSKLLVEGTDNISVVENHEAYHGSFTVLSSCGYSYLHWKLNGSSIIIPADVLSACNLQIKLNPSIPSGKTNLPLYRLKDMVCAHYSHSQNGQFNSSNGILCLLHDQDYVAESQAVLPNDDAFAKSRHIPVMERGDNLYYSEEAFAHSTTSYLDIGDIALSLKSQRTVQRSKD